MTMPSAACAGTGGGMGEGSLAGGVGTVSIRSYHYHQPRSSKKKMATVHGRRVSFRRRSRERSVMRVLRLYRAESVARFRNRQQMHGHAPVRSTGTWTAVVLSALVHCHFPSAPCVSRACLRWSSFRRSRFTYPCVNRGGESRMFRSRGSCPTWGTVLEALQTQPGRRCRTDGRGETTATVATRRKTEQMATPRTTSTSLLGRDVPQLEVASGPS